MGRGSVETVPILALHTVYTSIRALDPLYAIVSSPRLSLSLLSLDIVMGSGSTRQATPAAPRSGEDDIQYARLRNSSVRLRG